jgi:restriction system protein
MQMLNLGGRGCKEPFSGNISSSKNFMRDTISEQIALKSGLLLTVSESSTLLRRHSYPDVAIFEGLGEDGMRVRPEDVEELIRHLRYFIGDLPDPRHPIAARLELWKAMEKDGVDPSPLIEALKEVTGAGKLHFTARELADDISAICAIDRSFVDRFAAVIAETMDRSVQWFQITEIDTSWALPLDDLFQAENIPADPETYLDQRYLDYLAQNSEDLHRIHWRNFERLTTEFFNRKGFEVELGPGGDDGGVDVRVWNKGTKLAGPPLLLIQCKRYKKTNEVQIESVKAFWTDVHYEGAYRGLIATTSRVAPVGIASSVGRRWPLGFAEHEQVSHWVKEMWRHSVLSKP